MAAKPKILFNATLNVNEQDFIGSGKTLIAALNQIADGFAPMAIKTAAVITIKHGDRVCTHSFYVIQLRQLLRNATSRQIWAKRLELILKTPVKKSRRKKE